jgi:hypothetical protein
VVELDVDPVLARRHELRDPVVLLEDHHELAADIVAAVELIEPERHRAGVVASDEQQACLDVVRAAEVVTLVERELPVLTGRRPLLDRLREDRERLVDLDVERAVVALLGRRPRLNL